MTEACTRDEPAEGTELRAPWGSWEKHFPYSQARAGPHVSAPGQARPLGWRSGLGHLETETLESGLRGELSVLTPPTSSTAKGANLGGRLLGGRPLQSRGSCQLIPEVQCPHPAFPCQNAAAHFPSHRHSRVFVLCHSELLIGLARHITGCKG